jgi:hypothetical protein
VKKYQPGTELLWFDSSASRIGENRDPFESVDSLDEETARIGHDLQKRSLIALSTLLVDVTLFIVKPVPVIKLISASSQ